MWRNEMQRVVCGFHDSLSLSFHMLFYDYENWNINLLQQFENAELILLCWRKKNYMEIRNQLRKTKFHIFKLYFQSNNFANVFYILISLA